MRWCGLAWCVSEGWGPLTSASQKPPVDPDQSERGRPDRTAPTLTDKGESVNREVSSPTHSFAFVRESKRMLLKLRLDLFDWGLSKRLAGPVEVKFPIQFACAG